MAPGHVNSKVVDMVHMDLLQVLAAAHASAATCAKLRHSPDDSLLVDGSVGAVLVRFGHHAEQCMCQVSNPSSNVLEHTVKSLPAVPAVRHSQKPVCQIVNNKTTTFVAHGAHPPKPKQIYEKQTKLCKIINNLEQSPHPANRDGPETEPGTVGKTREPKHYTLKKAKSLSPKPLTVNPKII